MEGSSIVQLSAGSAQLPLCRHHPLPIIIISVVLFTYSLVSFGAIIVLAPSFMRS